MFYGTGIHFTRFISMLEKKKRLAGQANSLRPPRGTSACSIFFTNKFRSIYYKLAYYLHLQVIQRILDASRISQSK